MKHLIRKRSVLTKSGAPLFKFFDGAIMMSYSKPSLNLDLISCDHQPQPNWCDQKAKLEIAKDYLVSNQTGREGQKPEVYIIPQKPEKDEKNNVNNSLSKDAKCSEQDTESCTWTNNDECVRVMYQEP